MRSWLIICLYVFGISCQSEQDKNIDGINKTLAEADKNFKELNTKDRAAKMEDSIIKSALFDTLNLSTAPVQIIDCKFIKAENTNFKNVLVKFKNISGKKIEAIRFAWYGVNAFGEPADITNGVSKGFGGGFTDKPLSPGRSDQGVWEELSSDGKKIIKAWPKEVAFADGTKWKSGYR